MNRDTVRRLLVLVWLWIPAALAAQQAPRPAAPPSPDAGTPSFPAQVEVVTVDAVVVDKKGAPVTGLTQADFTILEDGVPQSVNSFEAVQLPAAPATTPAAKPRVSTNASREIATGRTFVIVYDDVHMTRGNGQRAKGAIAEFLKNGVREGDRVTLVSTGGDAWWTARMEAGRDELIALLKRLEGRLIPEIGPERMSDHEAMRVHVYGDTQVEERVRRRFEAQGMGGGAAARQGETMAGVGDPRVRARASEVYYQAVSRNRITLEVLERILDSLASTKGRKGVVMVSEGFIYDSNLAEFKRVVQASRRSNCAVYFLDTRGLSAMPVYFTAEFGPPLAEQDTGAYFIDPQLASEGAENIAGDTGGFSVTNNNDLAKGIQRIAQESQAYYLIGYYPANTRADGRFRKIEVKVNRKDVRVRARKGYFAPLDAAVAEKKKEDKKKAVDPAFQQALDSPFEVDDIPLRMTAYVFEETLLGKAKVLVTTEVDVARFAFKESNGRLSDNLEFLLVTAHRESGEYFRYDQKVEMNLRPETRQRLLSTWFPIVREFELAPGGYQAKIVVRDAQSGRVGTVIHDFEVPDLAAFRASTPVLSDVLQPEAPGGEGRPQPALLARRSFSPGSTLFCMFEVYGAAKDKATGMPKVSAGLTIQRSDGSVLTQLSPTPIRPTSLGGLSRMVGTSLEKAAPGQYEAVLKLHDEVADKTLELREPFTVAGAPPAAGE